MRFLLNFFFFGILFYAIWYFFPESFEKLVHLASNIFDWLKEMVSSLINSVNKGNHNQT